MLLAAEQQARKALRVPTVVRVDSPWIAAQGDGTVPRAAAVQMAVVLVLVAAVHPDEQTVVAAAACARAVTAAGAVRQAFPALSGVPVCTLDEALAPGHHPAVAVPERVQPRVPRVWRSRPEALLVAAPCAAA